MTPCEKLGYKVGDEFWVVDSDAVFPKDGIIKLKDDDNTECPEFEGVNCLVGSNSSFQGEKCHFVPLGSVKPLPITLKPGDYVLTKKHETR